MWLYLPSSCAPASGCSEKACAPHSTFSASDTAPFATWNGKPLLPPSLPRLWKQERSIRRLCGLTLSPSEAETGTARWIASLPDSRARTSLSPDGARGSTASAADCSSTSWTSRTIAMRGASLWRTSAPSLLPPPPLWTKRKGLSTKEQPHESWENWPTAGGTRSGSLFLRPMWEPTTAAPGGSASRGGWPTPDAAMHGGSNRSESDGAATRPNISLAAKQWLTPHGMGTTDHSGKLGVGSEFAQQATQWMAPSVVSATGQEYTRDGGVKGQERLALPGQAMQLMAQWPTPAARDYRSEQGGVRTMDHFNRPSGPSLSAFVTHSPSSPQAQQISDGEQSSPSAPTSRQRLNPAFGCWLMGWPVWWTNPAITRSVKSEMASYRCALRSHLSSLLDEQGSPERKVA
jgi:hypothetical protein